MIRKVEKLGKDYGQEERKFKLWKTTQGKYQQNGKVLKGKVVLKVHFPLKLLIGTPNHLFSTAAKRWR